MKKDIELSIELYKDGTVMMETSSYSEKTHKVGTVEFTGTIDGRCKTFNPMEAMERSGLVTTKHDGNMFPNYKATNEFYKAFTSTGLVLGFADNISTQGRLNSSIEEAGVPQQQAFTSLTDAGVTTMADVYQLSDQKLKEIILK